MNMIEPIRELTDQEMVAVAGGLPSVLGAIKIAQKLVDLTGGSFFENWQEMANNL
jgi:hypothetical protein